MTKKSAISNMTNKPRRHAETGVVPELVDLGNVIRTLRTQHGLTQAQWSLASGVSRDTLIALENGRSGVSLGLALKALRGLGLTLAPTAMDQRQ